MALVLCLETATRNCSVALALDGKVVGHQSHCDVGYSHAEELHPFIEKVLAEAKYSLNDLDAIAVGAGPGSYTGLRIGISAAKGLAYALDIPLISIPTLSIIVNQALEHHWASEGFICPMIDARRMEVYTALHDLNGKEQTTLEAKIIDDTSFQTELASAPILFVGDGADKCEEVIKHANASFKKGVFPEATAMASIAQGKFEQQIFEDVAYFEPLYLKQFVAAKPKKQS